MTIQEIRAIAKSLGIKSVGVTKPGLIRAIQRSEGNFDCFGTAVGGNCDQPVCAWRVDCLPQPAVKTVAGKPAKSKTRK